MSSPGFVSRTHKVPFDFYSEPEYVTEELLKKEKFVGEILDPACGKGNIVKVLERNGYKVIATDIHPRRLGKKFNFMELDGKFENIVTNPPFIVAEDFVCHAFEIVNKKIAMFLRLSFLESIHRWDRIFCKSKLSKVYVFSARVRFPVGYSQKPRGAVSYGWFIWDMNYKGLPTIDWVHR